MDRNVNNYTSSLPNCRIPPRASKALEEESPPARAFESRIDDVVEDRSERITQPNAREITVRARKLPLTHQDVLVAQLAFREIYLVVEKRNAKISVQVESLEQADAERIEKVGAPLCEIVEICRAFERRADRSPRLLQIERHRYCLIRTHFLDLFKNRGVLIAEGVDSNRILDGE